MSDEGATGASYAAAGVDIEAGDRAVELMTAWVAKASRPEVVGDGVMERIGTHSELLVDRDEPQLVDL